MTKIIGHRGAAGITLENSLDSIRASMRQNVDAIEFDVHRTADGKIIVLHDSTTQRVSNQIISVGEKTLKEMKDFKLKDGQQIPTFEEVLKIATDKPLYVDIKDTGCADELLNVLSHYPKALVSFVSFEHSELERIHKLRPELPIYVLQHYRPLKIISEARRIGANGIGVNKRVINPLTYYLAQKYGLEVYTYTINSKLLARVFKKLYPSIDFCTDYPQRLRTIQ